LKTNTNSMSSVKRRLLRGDEAIALAARDAGMGPKARPSGNKCPVLLAPRHADRVERRFATGLAVSRQLNRRQQREQSLRTDSESLFAVRPSVQSSSRARMRASILRSIGFATFMHSLLSEMCMRVSDNSKPFSNQTSPLTPRSSSLDYYGLGCAQVAKPTASRRSAGTL